MAGPDHAGVKKMNPGKAVDPQMTQIFADISKNQPLPACRPCAASEYSGDPANHPG